MFDSESTELAKKDSVAQPSTIRGWTPAAALADFESFVKVYETRLVAAITRWIHDRHLAKDIAQQAFITTYKALHENQIKVTPKGYLWKVAFNLAKNELRLKSRRNEVSSETQEQAPVSGDSLLKKEVVDHVRKAIADLPPRQRETIQLDAFDGMSADEIAQIMGISKTTVLTQLREARAKLRKLLAHLGDEIPDPGEQK